MSVEATMEFETLKGRPVDIAERLDAIKLGKYDSPHTGKMYVGRDLLEFVDRNRILFFSPGNIFEPLTKKKVGRNSQVEVFRSKGGVILLRGGNSSGKSRTGITWFSAHMCLDRDPFTGVEYWPAPRRGRIGCPATKITDFMIPLLKEWIPQVLLIDGIFDHSYSYVHNTLTLSNGSKIDIKTYGQPSTAYESDTLHVQWFDEELLLKLYTASLARMVREDSRMLITVTALEQALWMDEELVEKSKFDKDIEVFKMSIHDNVYLDKKKIQKFLDKVPLDQRAARESGDFLSGAKLCYPIFREGIHTCKRFKIPEDATLRVMSDPHASQPSYFLWFATLKNGDHYLYDMLRLRETIPELSSVIKQMEGEIYLKKRVRERRMDPETGSMVSTVGGKLTIIDEFTASGLTFLRANGDTVLGRLMLSELLRYDPDLPISSLNHPKLRVFEDLYEPIADLRRANYQVIKDPLKWHCEACFRYFATCKPRWLKPINKERHGIYRERTRRSYI